MQCVYFEWLPDTYPAAPLYYQDWGNKIRQASSWAQIKAV